MLDLNPETRISAPDALKHSFMAALHCEADEPKFKGNIDFSFEKDLSLSLVKI